MQETKPRLEEIKCISHSQAVISLKYFAFESLADVITNRAGGKGKGEDSLFQQKWWRWGREPLEAGPKEPVVTNSCCDLMIRAS